MDLQGPRESGDRGQQALLKTDKGQLRQRRLMRGSAGDALHAQLAIGREPAREHQLRRVVRQARDANGLDIALGKRLAEAAQDRP